MAAANGSGNGHSNGPAPSYAAALRAPLSQTVRTADEGPAAGGKGRAAEWRKVLSGDPVEINPSAGDGFRVMSVAEWAARWRRNGDAAAYDDGAAGAAGAAGAGAAAVSGLPAPSPLGRCLACGSDDTKEHGE